MNPYLNSLNGFGGGFIAFWPNQGGVIPDSISTGVLSLILSGQSIESFIDNQGESLPSAIAPVHSDLSMINTAGVSIISQINDTMTVSSGIDNMQSVISLIDQTGTSVTSANDIIGLSVLSSIEDLETIISMIQPDGESVSSDIDETGHSTSVEL